MTFDSRRNEEYRFGSAAWAKEQDLRRAELFSTGGLHLGYFNGRGIRLEGDAPLLTIGGAGSGKLRDLEGHVAINALGQPILWLDPRGEIGAISIHVLAPAGQYGCYWNPMRIAGLPSHSVNPLDILDANSPRFHADTKFICEGLIALSGSANGQYFELRGREWLGVLIKALVEQHGWVSFPMLWRAINMIEGNPSEWADMLKHMLASRFEDVRRVAAEMLTKQQESPKEFGSILGEIYAHLSFLNDPTLLASLEGGDFSLKDLCRRFPVTSVFLNVPAEYLRIWSPLIRVMVTVVQLYKSRDLSAPRITIIIDEAGQLGRFEALISGFTFGRGFGVRMWALFQDIGQIVRNFDKSAVQSLMGSAQARQFFGVRDYETADLVSKMLGAETLSYDAFEYQQNAKREKWNAAKRALYGGDPLAQAYDYAHYQQNAEHQTKQGRPLLTPDEILNLPEDRQVLFVSGKNLNPILGQKQPYYELRENAGRYLPNPYHPPADRVRVKTRFGHRWARVIDAPVPEKWAAFPQYQNGRALHIEGYRL
ncbi:MAG: type IV secretory system conjugative DNA transfer family protein [Parvibaculum sp.]|uniref:type IV secretory system conjugative DNA transfer family protein n=1 Tax=Parvibaculum sp. TaxID=2024848 RepID=UPI003265BD95